MAEIRVRSINPFHRRDFLSRVFEEMSAYELPDGQFPIGRSLSWKGFRTCASREDLAAICTNALDMREPNVRPDRLQFAAFRLSLGTHLLDFDLPFTRPQLCVLGEAVIMQLRTGNAAYPTERLSRIIRIHAERRRRQLSLVGAPAQRHARQHGVPVDEMMFQRRADMQQQQRNK